MDTRTGLIHEMLPGETLAEMEKRLNARSGEIVPLQRLPVQVCRKCGGKGFRKAGLLSKRFKPCECTR